MRTLNDSTGVLWTVYEVKRENSGKDRISYLPEQFGDGWLCFESSYGKRRLTPVPPRWREFGDEEMERLLIRAAPVNRPRGSTERPAADANEEKSA